MSKITEFWHVYRLYARHHSRTYAIKRAWHIAVQGADF